MRFDRVQPEHRIVRSVRAVCLSRVGGLLLGLALGVGRISSSVAAEATLTNFQQIIALGRAGATDAPYPARVRGVVVFPSGGGRELLHLTDGTNGLGATLLTLPGLRANLRPPPKVGDYIEVEGETAAGSSHPYVARATVRYLGQGRFPTPRLIRAGELAAGQHHGGFVRLRATILDVSRVRGHAVYQVLSDGYEFPVALSEPPERLPLELLNAGIEVQGMPWTQFDGAGRATSFRLLVGSSAWQRVLKPGSSNLFTGNRYTLAAMSNAPFSDERLVVSGVVTYVWPEHFLALQDATGVAIAYPFQPLAKSSREGEYVSRPSRGPLRPGDRIELVGAKDMRRAHAPQLRHSEYRLVGREELPKAPLITETDALTGVHDCRRVRVRGRILDRDGYEQFGAKVSRLWLKMGEHTAYAIFAASNHVEFAAPTGRQVELSGLCVVSAGAERPVRSFVIYLNSPADVRVLPEPPVWLSATALRVGGVAGGLVALTLSWVWLLRRQVARQTAALRQSNEQLEAEVRKRQRSQAAYVESETRTRLVVDTALDAVIAMDADGIIRSWNAQAARTFGWSAEEALGRPLVETIVPISLRSRHAQGLKHFLATGEGPVLNKRIEINALHRAGNEFPIELSIAPMKVGGRWIFSAFARDISERKRAEDELLKALARERELGELKTSFVSMVSHEFRTPLEVIVSSADILDRYLDRLLPPERAEHLRAIQDSVRRMSGMMEDVLLLGRFESARQQFHPDDVHLTAFCRRLVDEIASATNNKCRLELTLDEALPLARADQNLLRHILTNLLSNAVKYSPAGSSVELTLTRDQADAVWVIADRGLGIPEADQAQLFQAFHRGRNAGQIPGTGLGLVIVKRSVELHGGQIECVSQEGKGTRFTVRLPVFDGAGAAAP